MDRLYATVAEVMSDLGDDTAPHNALIYQRIESASRYIEGKSALGANFIPLTAAKRYDGRGGKTIWVDPLTSITSIVDDTTTLASTDYLLYPRNRHFDPSYGPYTRIDLDPDAASLTAWANERDIVVVTGKWGKWEQTISTGLTVANTTSIAAGVTALKVNDGGKMTAGMVLLCGSEQMLVTGVDDVSAAQWTVKRGVNGTTDAEHLNGVAITRYIP